MKKLYFIFCMGILLAISGCAGSFSEISCPEDSIKIIKEEPDDAGFTMRWFDVNCDNVCDGAVLFDPDEVPLQQFSCEDADKLLQMLTDSRKKMGV